MKTIESANLPVAVLGSILVFLIVRGALTRRARAQGKRTPASKALLLAIIVAVAVVVRLLRAVANIVQSTSKRHGGVVRVVELNHLAFILILSVIGVRFRLAKAAVGR